MKSVNEDVLKDILSSMFYLLQIYGKLYIFYFTTSTLNCYLYLEFFNCTLHYKTAFKEQSKMNEAARGSCLVYLDIILNTLC